MQSLIKDKKRIKQICDFNGLRFGSISPTDIDFFLDFKNQVFVFGELKYKDAKVPIGQMLALERLCDATQGSGKTAVAIIAVHQAESEADIDVATALVLKYRYKNKWHLPMQKTTVKNAIVKFLTFTNLKVKL